MDRAPQVQRNPKPVILLKERTKYYKTSAGESNSRNRVRVVSEMERFENVVVYSRGRWLEG